MVSHGMLLDNDNGVVYLLDEMDLIFWLVFGKNLATFFGNLQYSYQSCIIWVPS